MPVNFLLVIVIYDDVYRYVPIYEDPQRMHLRNLQEFHTQQKDPRDKDAIRQWINRLALHKGWEPEEFFEPYVSSSDEDSEEEEQFGPGRRRRGSLWTR